MAAIQGENIRNGTGKTMLLHFASSQYFRSPSSDIFWEQLFIAKLLVVNLTVWDELM
jgi:ABC-type molybdenum transport system ATPase subunit/photorepair protein PhrA